jgi:methylmalonyl-CoA mutase N-terminal domain/subunit
MTGGILRGIEDGWFSAEIAEASFTYQRQLEKGEKKVVGVNCYTETVETPVEILRVSHEVERAQVRDLARRRAGRDQAAVDAAIAAMLDTARSGGNMIPPMIDAAMAEVTLGEICDVLREEWGAYFEAPAF